MDQFDRAQKLEQQQRDRALKAARHRPAEQPIVVDGIRVCIDCMDDIEAQRLKYVDDAVRCISCQRAHERRNGQ